MAETPVSTGSRGRLPADGVERGPATGAAVAAPRTGGPPSSGSPRPLQTRPSQPAPTGTRSGSPVNATRGPARVEAGGALEDLDDGEVPVDLEHQPVPRRGPPRRAAVPMTA